MKNREKSKIPEFLTRNKKSLLESWLREQLGAEQMRLDLITKEELRHQSREFLNLFTEACAMGSLLDFKGKEWEDVRNFLSSLSKSWAAQGFSPTETVMYIYSLKQPLFSMLKETLQDEEDLFYEIGVASHLLDGLGLYTNEEYQRRREELILRQQQEMLELSTPVVRIWNNILVLPLIGTLDSERTQVVMESLLGSIVETESNVAIIDITGVPTVDTLVAQHLMKTVAAAKLMGAQCIISGIRPQIAFTMVQLDLAFHEIVTKSSLRDALAFAFKELDLSVVSRKD